MILASDMRHRLSVFQRVPVVRDGEDAYEYRETGRVWGNLSIPARRMQMEQLAGGMVRPNVTHRLIIRQNACRLTTDTYFMYHGQRYDVQYWQPYYKKQDRVEVLLNLAIEDGDSTRPQSAYCGDTV